AGAGTPPPQPSPTARYRERSPLSRDAGEGFGGAASSSLSRTAGEGARARSARAGEGLTEILHRAVAGETLAEADIVRLFEARGEEFDEVCAAADALRRQVSGDTVTYVV